MSVLTDGLISGARALLGVPFLHQGRSAVDGVDCAGLLVLAAQTMGVPVLDSVGYGPFPHDGELEGYLAEQPRLARRDWPDDRQPGDLLLLRMFQVPQHLALQTSEDTMIHSWEGVGHVCEHRIDEKWAARIVAAYQFT